MELPARESQNELTVAASDMAMPQAQQLIVNCDDNHDVYVTFVPLLNKEAATVVEAFFRKIIGVHGAPQILLSDRGRNGG